MLEKVITSMNKEYETLETILDPIKGYDWALDNPNRIVSNAQNRVLGVCMFAQEYLDVSYDDIEPFFNDWMKKVNKFKK